MDLLSGKICVKPGALQMLMYVLYVHRPQCSACTLLVSALSMLQIRCMCGTAS